MDLLNTLWVERYRPNKLDEMILPDSYRSDFEVFIANRDIPILLFYGPPGGGKTAIAQILCSRNGVLSNKRENLLSINGSAQSTRGIGFVEGTIEPFLKIPPDGTDKNKVVFIDESDNLTSDSQRSLRNIIEKYSEYGRFIFTCNHISKMEEALMSRSQAYEFKQMPIDYIYSLTTKILEHENVKHTEEDLRFICESLYPDIRRTINTLQRNSMSGELKIDKSIILTTERKIITYILEIINFINSDQKNKIGSIISEMISLLNDRDIEYRRIYEDLFFRKEVPANCKIFINKYSNEHQTCMVPSMHFMSLVFDIVSTLTKYREMSGKYIPKTK